MPFWTKGLHLIIASAYPVDQAIWLPIWRGKEAGIFAFLRSTFIHPNYFGLRSLLKTGDLFGLKYIYGELTRREGKILWIFPL